MKRSVLKLRDWMKSCPTWSRLGARVLPKARTLWSYGELMGAEMSDPFQKTVSVSILAEG